MKQHYMKTSTDVVGKYNKLSQQFLESKSLICSRVTFLKYIFFQRTESKFQDKRDIEFPRTWKLHRFQLRYIT